VDLTAPDFHPQGRQGAELYAIRRSAHKTWKWIAEYWVALLQWVRQNFRQWLW